MRAGADSPQGPVQPLASSISPELIEAFAETLQAKFPALFPRANSRDSRTVAEVVAAYLKDVPGKLEERHLSERTAILDKFVREFGSRQVSDCTPHELREWITSNYPGSPWTRMRINASIQRAFNWAALGRFTRENPFRGLTFADEERQHGRDMKPSEFRALVSATDPFFRRFLFALRFTGARPGELAALEWSHIDWQRGVAILKKHKTGRKTGKPRCIQFARPAMKLLAWIRRHAHGPAACELRRILLAKPDREAPIREVVKEMRELGFSYRALYCARAAIGAKYIRRGGWREHGRTYYVLPDNAVARPIPSSSKVFLCSKATPWDDPHALSTKFRRLRKRLKLPVDCKLYGLRHCFITEGVKRGTNLKALATIVGHTTTAMIERHYCHLDNDFGLLHKTVEQALGLAVGPPVLFDVNGEHQPIAPSVQEPERDTPEALPANQESRLLEILTARLMALEEQVRNPKPKPVRKSVFQKCHQLAYDLAQQAIRDNPVLRRKSDYDVFEWLQANRPEICDLLPPSAATFRRFLSHARRAIHGTTKAELRRLEARAIEPKSERRNRSAS